MKTTFTPALFALLGFFAASPLTLAAPKKADGKVYVEAPRLVIASSKGRLDVVQKLLDAGKQTWDFVTYPTGEHCFGDRPDYGADALRRSFQMFERHLKPVPTE
jgi:hypothetical protein